jgi:hypothetical protein
VAERDRRAEDATAHALASLPDGAWAVIHDVAWLDHVAVGPHGVFVIGSQDWPGRVTVEDGVLHRDGYVLTSAVEDTTTAAAAVAALLPAEHRDHVRGVICVRGSDGPIALVGDVLVCTTTTLVTLLTMRPAVLAADSVHAVASVVRRHRHR